MTEWIESIKNGNVKCVKIHHSYTPDKGAEVTNDTLEEITRNAWKMGYKDISIEAL